MTKRPKIVCLVEGRYARAYGTTSEASWIVGAFYDKKLADAMREQEMADRRDELEYYSVIEVKINDA